MGRKQKKYEWAVELAQALRKWCQEQKIASRVLGVELGIPPRTMRSIMEARQVVEKNTEVYAKLFRHTGLPEADPQTIPPRLNRLPGGRTIEIRRAWTEEEWQLWLAKQKKTIQRTVPVAAAPALQASLEDSLKLLVREAVREELGSSPDRDIGWHVNELLRLLIKEGDTSAARDEIAQKYSNEIAELLELLKAYEQPANVRDNILLLREASRGKND